MTDILATITKNKKPLTTVAINDVVEFSHSVEASASKRDGALTIFASLNGERQIIAFADRPRNSKSGFRQVWYKAIKDSYNLDIAIPEGFIVGDKTEAIEVAWWFRKQNSKRFCTVHWGRPL
jgi:ribosomal protein L20